MPNQRLDDDGDDLDFEIEIDEVITGSATPAGESSEVADLLLEMASACTRLVILMRELDREGWIAVLGRYEAMHSIFAQLPTESPPAKRVGFVRD